LLPRRDIESEEDSRASAKVTVNPDDNSCGKIDITPAGARRRFSHCAWGFPDGDDLAPAPTAHPIRNRADQVQADPQPSLVGLQTVP
jgi:hypothetical protein